MLKIIVALFMFSTSAYAIDPACTLTPNLSLYRCPYRSTDWFPSYTGLVDGLDSLSKTTVSSFTVSGGIKVTTNSSNSYVATFQGLAYNTAGVRIIAGDEGAGYNPSLEISDYNGTRQFTFGTNDALADGRLGINRVNGQAAVHISSPAASGVIVDGTVGLNYMALGSTATVSKGGLLSVPSQPRVRFSLATSHVIPPNVIDCVFWGTNNVGPLNMVHSTSASSDTFKIAAGMDGDYIVNACIRINTVAAGTTRTIAAWYVNGVLVPNVEILPIVAGVESLCANDMLHLAASDSVKFCIFTDRSQTTTNADANSNYGYMYRVP